MSNVSHPKHYNTGKIEVIEFLEDKFSSDPHLWNAVKYLSRAGKKDASKFIEDLEKAIWYIRRRMEIESDRPRRPNDMVEKIQVESVVCDHASTELFLMAGHPEMRKCRDCEQSWPA